MIFSVFWGSADLISGIQVMLIVVVGAALAINGEITPGEYITFISYNSMLIWPVRMLGRMIANVSKAGVSLDRIYYIMSSEQEKDKENALTPEFKGADIVFENVSFAYDGCPELLHNISFTVKAGSTVGIIGGTGSGKSTLVHLLGRLYELPEGCGSISIGGRDIRGIKAKHLRQNVGIVLQEPYLFSRTIAENIAITKDCVNMEEVRCAATSASLDDTVMAFADGYETFVGEKGVTLSGGQKQRTAIARMLTQKTPIMIFDDSLSAVDAETDAKIRKALSTDLGSATVFLISHRIATLMNSDLIIVLDKGRIVEMGNHASLMEIENGIYRRIYNVQMSDPDGEGASA
jgi:ATP-binding cassette subfamily B protein